LIPETFDGYKKQRYRWTYGPVQELKRHWRRYLPAAWGGSRRLSPTQKLHHANHGLNVASVGLRLVTVPLAVAAAGSLLIHHERVPIPFELWWAGTLILVASTALRYAQYRVAGASAREALGATVAYRALAYTITVAAVTALIGREVPWRRTNKFRHRPGRVAALAATRIETTLGVAFFVAAAVTICVGKGGMATFLGLGFAGQAAGCATAPLVAFVANSDLERAVEGSDGAERAPHHDAQVVVEAA
jgi:hypothetical protein